MALTIPNTFVAGTKIEAAPMNSNFAEVANAVDKRGDTLTGNLAANAGVKVDGVDVSTIPVDGSGNFNPLFNFVVLEAATTAGIRLDLESGVLAVREGDDSAYGPLISGQHTVSGALLVASNDGGALGASGTAWSDLFLASGGVINWNAGNATLTHSAGLLTSNVPLAVNSISAYGASGGLRVKSASGSVIGAIEGTNSAGYSLFRISNDAATGYAGLQFGVNGATTAAIYASEASLLSFETNGSARLNITSGGNVGIGTTNPTFGVGSGLELSRSGVATYRLLSNSAGVEFRNDAGTATLETRGASPIIFATNQIERMRITSAGLVGINQTNPTEPLHVVGTARSTRARVADNDASGPSFAFQDDTDTGLFRPASDAIGFATAGTERMRLTGANLAIGATARIYLDGVAGTGDTYIYESGSNTVSFFIGGSELIRFDTGSAKLQKVYDDTTASAANVFVASDGRMSRSTSSLRYKHDIAPLDTADAHAALMAMRPVTYRGKTDEDQRRYVGFIAEEMQQIAPLLCTYDEGGESGTPNYVTYDRITAYLVAVVQQQQAEIDALKARIH
jgi:hypothetical protein